jgi:putative molybdopterin-guanine dinucleotide biosynthesis protein
VSAPRADVAAIVVGGGGGEGLGGGSKPDLILGGVRLIDRVCGVLMEACGAGCVAVVPPSVRVPDGVLRTLEDPPSGGPLAGIDAGLRALGVGDDVLVVVVSVDAPGVGAFLPALLESALGESSDGRIVRGGDPEPFDQYLMGVYRAGALRRNLDEAVASLGSVRGVGVRRVLRALEVERVNESADVCRDIDTPEDIAWWESFLSN